MSIVRHVVVAARRETVFRFFTDSRRFAAWWGEGSRIDPRPGGEVFICYPGGATASGVVKHLEPPARIELTFGFHGEGKPIPPGGSTLRIALDEIPEGTRVTLTHTDLPEGVDVAGLTQGWRYQLALYARVASADQHADVAEVVDRWFAAWGEADPAVRRAALAACCTPDVVFHDDFSATEGLDELDRHLAAARVHMPGVTLARAGEVKQCQGTALARWNASSPKGPMGEGTNVFELSPDSKIRRATGFWGG